MQLIFDLKFSMFRGLLRNKNFKDFLNESAIHGLRLLLYYTPFKYARLLWMLFIIAFIIWTHCIIITLIFQYIQQPTEVHMSTDMIHVSNTPFPSLAICSANVLSRAKLQTFAEKVFEKQQQYRPNYLAHTSQEMALHLLYLKDFYVFPYDSHKHNNTVLRRLDKIFTFMYNSTDHPIRDHLRKLAPDCQNVVIRGTIFDKEIKISDYISQRLTSSNVCCMFNYKRESYAIDLKIRENDNKFLMNTKTIKFQSNSILNSLQFVLQSDPDDFTYTEFKTHAFQLFIFPSEDYATIQSNRIGEILIDYNTVMVVPIQPKFFSSTRRVRQFKPEIRKCYFPDEGQKLLNQSYYSLDECLLICRMQSMITYCGCVTPPMTGTDKNVTYCNFKDLPCLKKWKFIWYGWDSYDYVHENGRDLQDDLTAGYRCPHCLPTCNGVNYDIYTDDMTLSPAHGEFYNNGILKGLTNARPLAIVQLYFKDRYVQATEMDIRGDWVVLLGRFGGIMSLMYGFSIISYIEILYFASGKFFAYFFEKLKLKLQNKLTSTISTLPEPPIRSNQDDDDPSPLTYNLYWNELKPKQPVNMEIFKDEVILNLYKRENI